LELEANENRLTKGSVPVEIVDEVRNLWIRLTRNRAIAHLAGIA
jgi:hypothetical protein